jgi:hypothetical protein
LKAVIPGSVKEIVFLLEEKTSRGNIKKVKGFLRGKGRWRHKEEVQS